MKNLEKLRIHNPALAEYYEGIANNATHAHRFFGRFIQNHVMQSVNQAPDLERVAPVYLEIAYRLSTNPELRKEFLTIMELAQ